MNDSNNDTRVDTAAAGSADCPPLARVWRAASCAPKDDELNKVALEGIVCVGSLCVCVAHAQCVSACVVCVALA